MRYTQTAEPWKTWLKGDSGWGKQSHTQSQPAASVGNLGELTSPYRPGQSWGRLGNSHQPCGGSDRVGHGWLQLYVPRDWGWTTYLTVLKRA